MVFGPHDTWDVCDVTREYDAFNHRPPPRKRGLSAEWRLQCACAKIARRLARADKAFRYEFINIEGARDPKRSAILKMMGSEPGTLEVRLYYRRGDIIHIAVGDCKSAKGKPSPAQRAWLDYYQGTQILGFIIYSVEDFMTMVRWVRE